MILRTAVTILFEDELENIQPGNNLNVPSLNHKILTTSHYKDTFYDLQIKAKEKKEGKTYIKICSVLHFSIILHLNNLIALH